VVVINIYGQDVARIFKLTAELGDEGPALAS
jgi:hypothetical protein